MYIEDFPIRVNKFLTCANYCSRREADRLIEKKRVRINAHFAELGEKVNEGDQIFVDGKKISAGEKQKIYLAYYKPTGVICTTQRYAKDNIIRAVNFKERVYPIGRLDVKTEGLILLTNDGSIVNKILKSEGKIEKEYLVEVNKKITKDFLEKLAEGVVIDGYRTLPAKTRKLEGKLFSIIITEGKNRQIRKMCEVLGCKVIMLKRTRIGNITVENLKSGQYRKIKHSVINKLMNKRMI